jgi:pyruvate dehydrogenase (quinone)/pyruvate oxidase
MVVLSGQVPRAQIGTDYKQYVDEERLISPLAVYSAQVTEAQSAIELLKKAFHEAIQRQGVAHLSLPLDILQSPSQTNLHPPEPYLNTIPESSIDVVLGAIPFLSRIKKPLILLGKGGRIAAKQVMELAESWGAGIILSLGAKGAIAGHHPLVIGGLGQGGSPVASQLLNSSDGILIIGSNWWPKQYVPEQIPIIQIDNVPQHIGVNAPVAYGIVGSSDRILTQLLSDWQPTLRTEWSQEVKTAIANWRKQLDQERRDPGQPVHPQRLIGDLESVIDPNAIITLDVGDHTVWFNRTFYGERQEILLSGNWRSMGFGLPAAIQAKISHPDRQVLALVGDGGFAMTPMEFCTAAYFGLNIMVVVVNNGCLAMEKNRMIVAGLEPNGVNLANPDFVALAKACGGDGRKVEDPRELVEAYQWGLKQNGPVLIDVHASAPILPHTTM